MEVSGPSDLSAPQDLSILSEKLTDPPNSANYNVKDLCVNDLQDSLGEILEEDFEIPPCGITPQKNDIGNVVSTHEHADFNVNDSSNLTSKRGINKCATFPPFGENTSSANDLRKTEGQQGKDTNGKSVDQCYPRSMSLPTTSKLVSAMKGSREKLGMPPQKLSVTWAPDVYDPAPTAVSHVLSNNSQIHQSDSKRHGKNKQKGGAKSSRGNKGKGKGKRQNLKKTTTAHIHYAQVVC